MPTYDMKCSNCGHEQEVFCKIDDRHHQPCPECSPNGLTVVVHCMEIVYNSPNNANLFFKEGWYEHIDHEPLYIKSMKQLKHECAIRGHTSVYAEDSTCLK